jgi:cyclopropane fatty-acyl-phospholipid synthase-like methyltransferase
MICRGCGASNLVPFIDLGFSPISNELIPYEDSSLPESNYPLAVFACDLCGFVQIPEIASREVLFPENYVYYSSFSSSWLEHSREYAIKMCKELNLTSANLTLEVASNDGYLLQYFVENGVQVLGIEPSRKVAEAARAKGIETKIAFFGADLARNLKNLGISPSLMVANNVLAHVPDINDFVAGFSILLPDDGIATFEFPHLSKLIENNQFDTIYHEHYSYLSLEAVDAVFEKHGLQIYDVEQLSTHGGSLRVYVSRIGFKAKRTAALYEVAELERKWSPHSLEVVKEFRDRSFSVKLNLLDELIRLKRQGKKVVGYGAAAKGNTLLNYSGIRSDLIDFVVDRNPAKQSMLLPGSHIPVLDPSELLKAKPDVVLILPWNLAEEIHSELKAVLPDSIKYLIAIPELRYL